MIDYSAEFLAAIQLGAKFRVYWGAGNVNNELRHIRAVVDDSQVVYRVWSKHRRDWQYQIDDMYAFWLYWSRKAVKP